MPFFSVVISLYNKEKFISQTLKSVLNQTFTDFEVVIINDGSTDNSVNIVNGFNDDRIVLFTQKNSGASATRNNGIKKANAEFIALLDGDDFWHENYLQTIHDAINKHPKEFVFATAIANKYNNKSVKANYSKQINKPVSVLNYFKNSLKYSLLTSSSVVFKKEILKQTGWFDTDIKSGQDTDLWIRFGLHFPVVFINKVLVYYVYDNDSLSNTTYNAENKPKFDKYLSEEQTNKDLKTFLDLNRYSMAILSKLYKKHSLYKFYRGFIEPKNLPLKKRILLSCPRWLLLLLLKLKALKGEKVYYKPL